MKWTEEKIKEFIEKENYILIEIIKYNGLNSTVKIRCQNKQHEPYIVTFENFKYGRRCRKCRAEESKNKKSEKWNKEAIIDMVEIDGTYEFIDFIVFNKSHSRILIKCLKCGYIREINVYNFKTKNKCPRCKNILPLTFEYVKAQIEKDGSVLLSDKYINAKQKLEVQCPNGHKYYVKWNNFQQGKRCPYCNGGVKLSYEYVKEYIESFGYKLLSKEYINNSTKLLVECPESHVYKTTFNNFKSGRRCIICNMPYGEQDIRTFLEKYNIYFETQYVFNDCIFYKPLPFDFYLPNYNILIEFDGIQHHKIIDFFGGLDGFIYQKIRDTIKTQYCKDNDIKLIRIPYWEFNNIENILKKELNLI